MQRSLDLFAPAAVAVVTDNARPGEVCGACSHGKRVFMDDPKGSKVPGAGPWVACEFERQGVYFAAWRYCAQVMSKWSPSASAAAAGLGRVPGGAPVVATDLSGNA